MNDHDMASLRLAAIIVALLGIFWFVVGAESRGGRDYVRIGSDGGGCGVAVFFGCR